MIQPPSPTSAEPSGIEPGLARRVGLTPELCPLVERALEALTGNAELEAALNAAAPEVRASLPLVFASSDHVGGSLSPEDAEAATETGLRYSTDAGPLEPGVYQLRVAFQDKTTGRLGARAVWIRVPENRKR